MAYIHSPGWLGTSILTAADRIERSDENVVCGVELASGPDRTGLTFLVPGEGAREIRDVLIACCGAKPGERHPDTCPRMIAWRESHCGAKPTRGQKLTTHHGWAIATGEEVCANDKGCQRHEADFGRIAWTNAPEWVICDACKVRTVTEACPTLIAAKDGERWREGALCGVCAEQSEGWEWRGDRLVRKGAGPVLMSGAALDAFGERYGLPRVCAEPDEVYRGRLVSRLRIDMSVNFSAFTDAVLRAADSVNALADRMSEMAGPARGFCAFIANLKAWEEGQKAERRQREAPLVALVSQVPEGLHPVGWRAAVLAADETYALCSKERVRWGYEYLAEWLPMVLAKGMDECDANAPYADALAAYRRAIAPHKAPPPERKTRGPRLTVDDGRDDD